MSELPLAPVRRLMKQAGAERVSTEAVEYLCNEAESMIYNIACDAVKSADHAGRLTVTVDDLDFVLEE